MKVIENREFGIVVKKRLIELDMTQRKLARALNINEKYLTDILRGRKSGLKYRTVILNTLNLGGNFKSDKGE